MWLNVRTGLKTLPITVIQGAYQEYCAPTKQVTFYVVDWYRAYAPIVAEKQAGEYIHDPSAEQWFRGQQFERKFQQLVADWQTQRGAMSSTTEAVMCQAYQSIIGMGPDAVPLILKQLEAEGDDPDQWFWALTAITQATPENPEDQGQYVKMAASWFEWAKKNGYAW